jgi:sugar/nucleoside kinase (ribokinase family)
LCRYITASLKGVGVGVSGVQTRQDAPTACAAVIVDAKGENQICVGSGANLTVKAAQLDSGGGGGGGGKGGGARLKAVGRASCCMQL